ncbi:MAG: GGDEF domain-containing protein [Firmicutes bacterium]|nr:GGDEF domain-containing protein [Bacillota bacterium]
MIKKRNLSPAASAALGLVSPLAIPIGLLLLSVLFWHQTPYRSDAIHPVIRYFSYAILLSGMALGHWFNRGRVFFIMTVLFLSQAVLFRPEVAGADIAAGGIYPLVSLLIPINFIVFSVWEERGITSPSGKKLLAFLAVQLLAGALLSWTQSQAALSLLNTRFIPFRFFAASPFPHLAFLLYLAAALTLFWRHGLGLSQFEMPFLGTLIATALSIQYIKDPTAPFIFFAVGGLIIIVMVLKDMYHKAYFDELTGLPTRRAMKEELLKLGNRYSFAMLDIDHFKKFNDTYGHPVGDQVLKFTAALMKNTGGGGKAFRYGGEEFAIVFPGKKADEASMHLEQLRVQISRRVFILRSKDRPAKRPETIPVPSTPPKRLSITVSIGVAEKLERHRTEEDLIKDADDALYRAKKKGRNCLSR